MRQTEYFIGSFIAILLTGCLIYFSVMALLNTPQFQQTSERSRYDQWIRESRLHEATARAIISERMRSMDFNLNKTETRADIVYSLEEYAGSDILYESLVSPLEDDTKFTITPTNDEAETRVSRREEFNPTSGNIGLEGREARLLIEQERRLALIEDRTIFQIEAIRTVLNSTQINMINSYRMIDRTDDLMMIEEVGMMLADAGVEENFIDKTQQVMQRIVELRKYQSLLQSTPLAVPLNVEYRYTSGFGFRIDPFTLQSRKHFGIDLVAFFRAPVLSTAPGRVVFTGVKSGYGNCVYIDHGNGFQTRYAHLQDISVRNGQEVNIGEQIGTMGSTGRSTGTHLHYEIWFRGRAVNPLPFIISGRQIYS